MAAVDLKGVIICHFRRETKSCEACNARQQNTHANNLVFKSRLGPDVSRPPGALTARHLFIVLCSFSAQRRDLDLPRTKCRPLTCGLQTVKTSVIRSQSKSFIDKRYHLQAKNLVYGTQ